MHMDEFQPVEAAGAVCPRCGADEATGCYCRIVPDEPARPALPAPGARARLKMEPIPSDENMLEQIGAAVARIEAGVTEMSDAFGQLLDKVVETAGDELEGEELLAVERLRMAARANAMQHSNQAYVAVNDLTLALMYIDRVKVVL